ncbi:MAG: 50S ribosome-binding GTPase [Lachnospiraceae bacterium]|nr:50S ribosome-binding GTPase [Lachnospiraceae bacterium]
MKNDLFFQMMSEKQKELENEVFRLFRENNSENITSVKDRLKEIEDESRLRIAFVGQHNAGKSTIISALTGNRQIRISANVETDATESYEWGNVILYDTPGLYAGVKTEHDRFAKEAINNSDLLVFCITSSLFDDLLIRDFVDLAYKRAYKNKIILLVNKMSQEDGEFDVLRRNYLKTLSSTLADLGGSLDDFPIAFVDAKDYREGILEEDDELVELSNFDSFIALLNREIEAKGLLAKLETKCNVLTDAIADEITGTGTELDKNMMTVLNRLTRTFRTLRRETRANINRRELDLRSGIMDVCAEFSAKVGEVKLTEADSDEVNKQIEKLVEATLSDIEEILQKTNKQMDDEIGGILKSDIGMYVFQKIDKSDLSKPMAASEKYMDFAKQFADFAGFIKIEAAKALGILKIVRTAGKVGKAADFFDPLMATLDVAVAVGEKIAEEKHIKEVMEVRNKLFNNFSSIASDYIKQIDKQYDELENELFESKAREIEEIKNSMVLEADNNSAYVTELKKLSRSLRDLVDRIEEGVEE